MNLFKRKNYIKITPVSMPEYEKTPQESPMIPDGTWVKCTKCKRIIYQKEMDAYKICPKCGGHFRLCAQERIALICDEGSFQEMDESMTAKNPMDYPNYENILNKAREKSGLKDGVVTGLCTIEGHKAVIAVMDSNFIMGSMGSVVGEKVTRAVEKATELSLPVVIFTTSGGARMQEGIISLMQMAKVSAAVKRHSEKGLLYVTVLTDPTTGGVTASFGMLGDIILSEPDALVGFAGKRVIEQTIKQELPKGFQTAEFQLEHGFVDKIVNRRDLKKTLGLILKLHGGEVQTW